MEKIRPARDSSNRDVERAAGSLLLATVLAISLAGAGCASSKYSEQRQEDRKLAARANSALVQAGVDPQRIEARCYRGVITLLGDGTSAERSRAEQAVGGLAGVVRVNSLVLPIVDKGSSTASGFTRSGKAPIEVGTASAGPVAQ